MMIFTSVENRQESEERVSFVDLDLGAGALDKNQRIRRAGDAEAPVRWSDDYCDKNRWSKPGAIDALRARYNALFSAMTARRKSTKLQLRRSISEQLRDSTSKAWDLLWKNVRERRLAGQCMSPDVVV
ncbi:hypothetical protein Baya_14718 [Bagarius yarrelli]|uniref:Uncharacterized protein n=1 Tax=Bagarius yarrelli TaxID=175774 RepID=A0A556VAL8_BAGYA|nr:hypothetical protein Baya_14718 [Bagarius yarrelli]